MEVKAKLRYLRQSPRKVRLVVDLIRGLEVGAALTQLHMSSRKATEAVTKLLKSAIANAKHNNNLKEDNLFIKEIKVDEGPMLKRWRARAFGRAAGIQKKTSHITIVLSEIKSTIKKEDKKSDKKIAKTKIVKSLDEVKQTVSKDNKEQGPEATGQVDKTTAKVNTKRTIFSRKSG